VRGTDQTQRRMSSPN